MPISEVEKFMKKFIKGFAIPKITNLIFYSGGKTFKFHIELGGLSHFEWNYIERETGFYMSSFSQYKDYIQVVFSR